MQWPSIGLSYKTDRQNLGHGWLLEMFGLIYSILGLFDSAWLEVLWL